MLNAMHSSGSDAFKPSQFSLSAMFENGEEHVVIDGTKKAITHAHWQTWVTIGHRVEAVPPAEATGPTRRSQEVSVRAGAALRFAINPSRVFRREGGMNHLFDEGVSAALADILSRAMLFEQALRVRYFRFASGEYQAPITGWFHGTRGAIVVTDKLASANAMRYVQLKDAVDAKGKSLRDFCTATVTRSLWSGYSSDGCLYFASFECSDRSVIEIDYDAHLADQTHPTCRSTDINEVVLDGSWKPATTFNWVGWYNGRSRPTSLRSKHTHGNQHFEKGVTMLARWFKCAKECWVKEPRHLDWRVRGYLRRILGDFIDRARAGTLPPSHQERLLQLDFTWGKDRTHISELIADPHGVSVD
jgi:hypothetical protein